ncbi:2-hydroxy-3-oxopropionate reductase [Methylophaga frappieri]|uniref:2-hydroxy-3-oxopropionate reductase n=1 Tax=Methylophaga frappieri (strain ATCC BAA-2434 / DSM 25690 / JAM7) TaxID=754477 RepID=I1YKX1_METFJ|nr:NAD(P)-dependent oxidoreductase [Methylophaga frappieri]AFJ03564.1 2-hydroxy-3-oxopropionate reductase [Methylophaga frappieri]
MRIAILGGGLMGHAMAERLVTYHADLIVYNRRIAHIEVLKSQGIRITDEVNNALSGVDMVILTLSDAEAIEAVLKQISPENWTNKLFIQMGTISPNQSISLAQWSIDNKAQYLECPVLGSLPEARNGDLILMAGGNQADYEAARPLLELLGKQPERIGEVGQAAAMKLAMNQLIAGLTASFSLSLGLIESHGVDVEQFMTLLRNSALYAPTFDKKLPRMQQRDFANPNFPTKHLLKDSHLFQDVAEQGRLDSSSLQGVIKLLDKAMAMGLSDTDYSAIYAAVSPDRK